MTRQQAGFAVLDGKPKTPEQRRQAIETELKALPELEAPPEVWRMIEKRLHREHHSHRSIPWRALAAGVFVAALAVTALQIDRGSAPAQQQVTGTAASHPAVADAVLSEPAVAAWMERSRLAESRRRTLPGMPGVQLADGQGLEARRLLAARIASVDESLNRLVTVEPVDLAARERLWRERAELMDTLVRAEQIQREDLIRRAVY